MLAVQEAAHAAQITRPIPILVYHQIAPEPPKGAPFRSLCVSPERFATHMRLLKFLGIRALSMSDLMPYLLGQKTGKVVGLTFDDGYLNNLQNALPVLAELGFTSTCYAVSAMGGQTNAWDADLGIAQVPLMTAAQLHEWAAAGQAVGAHTRHHVRLCQLSEDAAREEISGSKAELEDQLARPVDHFCYPYGDYAPVHAEMVREAGFRTATTTQRGRCHGGNPLVELPRVPVLRSTSWLQLWLKVKTSYEDQK